MKNETPYIANKNRLENVIAAIQVLGSYRVYKLKYEEWAMRISGDKSHHENWKKIFKEHPEFFRYNKESGEVSLIWRRSKPRRYHIDRHIELTKEKIDKLPEEEQKKKISRSPLDKSEMQTLINTAMNLYGQAFENKKDSRWWIIPLASSISGFIGILIGALINK